MSEFCEQKQYFTIPMGGSIHVNIVMDWKYKAFLQLMLSVLPWGETINYRFQRLNSTP